MLPRCIPRSSNNIASPFLHGMSNSFEVGSTSILFDISKNSSILGNKSKELEDEALKGKLKGKGKKTIICRKCIEPIYSQKSIRKGLEGITIIKVTIDKNGLVISAKVIDSSGHKDIDDASISAAMKSIFLPISEASTITIKYEHKIK